MYIKKIFLKQQIEILQQQYKKEKLYYQISIGIFIFSSILPFFIPIFIDFPSLDSIVGNTVNADVYGIQSNSGGLDDLNQVFGQIMIFFTLSTILSIIGIIGMVKYKKKSRIEKLKSQFKKLLNQIPGIPYNYFIKLLKTNKIQGEHIQDKDNNIDHFIETGYIYYTLKNGQVVYINTNKNPKDDLNAEIKEEIQKLQVLPKISYYLSY